MHPGQSRNVAGMDRANGQLIVSPTDLAGFLACGHLSVLHLEALDGHLHKPNRDDAELEVLQRRGLEHEAAYLASLARHGLNVSEIAEPAADVDRIIGLRDRAADTVAAMRAGADIVERARFGGQLDRYTGLISQVCNPDPLIYRKVSAREHGLRHRRPTSGLENPSWSCSSAHPQNLAGSRNARVAPQ
ncbi:MAG: hypothetical protein ACI8RE_000698 [Ilumatobacter sp.]|jgi:hypothetical protein